MSDQRGVVQTSRAMAPPAATMDLSPETANTVQVLLVEDSGAQAELIAEMLEAVPHDYRLSHVSKMADAIQHLRARVPDLVLLDLNLPDSRNLDGIEQIRSRVPGVPIVVLTNVENERTALDALRFGAEDYVLKKQLSPDVLVRAMRYAVERSRAETALRESEERYALALAGANDGIWDWDIARDQAYFSQRCRTLLGMQEHEQASMEAWLSRIHPEDLSALEVALEQHLANKTDAFEHEHRICDPDDADSYIWVHCRGVAIRGANGKAHRIAGSINDITRRKRAEERLVHDALHDALTGLPNRTLLLNRLEHAIGRFKREHNKSFAVLYFDLDRFKTINDSLGHTIGDELLIGVARRLETFLRPGDSLARLGGDEFAILLGDVGRSRDVTVVTERIHELLQQVFVLRGHEVFTSASIGIALSSLSYDHPEEMLRDSDLAMYRAKSSHGCSFEVFDNEMHEQVLAQHRLEVDLRRAVERDEFFNHYQTIVSVPSNQIVGFEVLLRWRHPTLGIIAPDRFISTAEETGLIIPIGWRALREACVQTLRWQKLFPIDPPLTVSVNISGKFFAHRDFIRRIEEILADTGFASNCLRLEITEQALMNHAEDVLVSLAHLRELGIQLNIDDFGTGYSSLTYLQRFSYDSLKIDRSFVRGVTGSSDDDAIVRAIVALANSLDMKVIAEGVETAEQLDRLREINCPEAQGFWFSQPMPADEMSEHLRAKLQPFT